MIRPSLLAMPAILLLGMLGEIRTASAEPPFDDPLFRRCISWLLDGNEGALIDNLCLDDYSLPSPSLFLCARRALDGFSSEVDREGCAVLFEEQARKTRSGFVK
jgi:hypothetical protein